MFEPFIGKRIRVFLNSTHGFATLTGILMNVGDDFISIDTYKGIENVNIAYIVSFMEVPEGD